MAAPSDMRNPPAVYEYNADGWDIWAGRTASDNDRLSIKVARGNDWWFHVKGMPGSHVVLFVREGIEPPKSVIEAAASVAAYHSKQRNGGIVAVTGTRAKFVTKPRGAKAGSVMVKKESVFKVRPGVPE